MVVNNLERSRDEHTIHGRHWTLEQKVNLEQDVGVLNLEMIAMMTLRKAKTQEEVHLSSGKGNQGEDQQNQHHLSNRGKLIMTNWLVFLPFIQVSICLKI